MSNTIDATNLIKLVDDKLDNIDNGLTSLCAELIKKDSSALSEEFKNELEEEKKKFHGFPTYKLKEGLSREFKAIKRIDEDIATLRVILGGIYRALEDQE